VKSLERLCCILSIYPQIATNQLPEVKEQPQIVTSAPVPKIQAPAGKVVVPNVTGKSIREAGETLNTIGSGYSACWDRRSRKAEYC
jgi:hypothetical protein